MNLRKKCSKMTGLILAIAVGLLLTGALFHQTFCREDSPTLTSLGGEIVVEPPVEEETKREKKKAKKRRVKKENIRAQQSKIKERLIRLERTLDRKLESKLEHIRRLKHHDRSAAADTGTDKKSN